MKYIHLSFFIFCSLMFSPAFAYITNEKAPNMRVGVVDFPDTMSLNRIHMAFYRFDHAINAGEQIALNDGSVWSIGWWWQYDVTRWGHEDIIKLSYHSDSNYNFVKIENISRNEEAWGNVYSEPDAFSPHCLWITNIDVKSIIVLNNGLTFKVSRSYWVSEYNWEPGDLITIMACEDKSCPYALFNHTKYSIIFNAKMQQYPIGIMSPMAKTQ